MASTEVPWALLGDDRAERCRVLNSKTDRGKGVRRCSSVIHFGPSDGMTPGTTKQSTHMLGLVPWVSGHSSSDSRVGLPLAV